MRLWPIYIYLLFSVMIAISTWSNAGWLAGARAIAAPLLFFVAGVGLRSGIHLGGWVQKLALIVIVAVLAGLAHWLAGGFSVVLFGLQLSGEAWGWIGFALCMVFVTRADLAMRQPQ